MIVGSDYTTNPATKLVVSHSGANGILLNQDAGNTADSGRIFFEGTSTSAIMQQDNDLSFRTGATTGSSSGTERMKIDTSGNVSLPNDGQSLYIGAGNDLRLLHSGTEGYLYSYTGALYVGAVSTDQDVFIRGNDGGASINAVQFDMSDAGTAIFNHDIWVKTDLGELQFGAGKDGRIYSYEDNFYIGNFTAGKDTIFQNLNSAGSAYVTNLFIDGSAERVGIGTASPDSKLQVEYTTTSNGSAAIAEFGTSGSGAIANSRHQVIIGGPSVGGYTGLLIYSDSISRNGQISFADGRGANDSWRGTIVYEHSTDAMEFWTNATEK